MGDGAETAGPRAPMQRSGLLRRAAGLTAGGSPSAPGAPVTDASGRLGGRGLYDRVNRISQLVCNVSDLERAKEFWERVTPMRAVAKISTPTQAFRGLGIDRGRFEGYVMKDRWDPGDSLGSGQFELHLVQWKEPGPVGAPYSSARNVGWYRLAFRTEDPWRTYEELVGTGIEPYSPPATNPIPPLIPVSGFGFPDPDGVAIQILRGEPGHPDRLSHLAGAVTDLERQLHFYRDTLGLVTTLRTASSAIPNPWDREGVPGSYEALFQRSRGDGKLSLDIVQWGEPNPSRGRPYSDPTNLGYAQIVLEVDDIADSYRILRQLERRGGAAFRLVAPPETWDLGPEVGPRTTAILYDVLGIRYQLVEAPRYPLPSE